MAPAETGAILTAIRDLREETGKGFSEQREATARGMDALHERVTSITNDCAARRVVLDEHESRLTRTEKWLVRVAAAVLLIGGGTPIGMKILDMWLNQ